MQSREDTQMKRPTNVTCLETTSPQTKWKGEEGRFKRKRTILVSKNSNPEPNCWKTNLERGFSIWPHPFETLPWPRGLRDFYPVNSVDMWREFLFTFSGKQENKLLWSFLTGVMKGWTSSHLSEDVYFAIIPLRITVGQHRQLVQE